MHGSCGALAVLQITLGYVVCLTKAEHLADERCQILDSCESLHQSPEQALLQASKSIRKHVSGDSGPNEQLTQELAEISADLSSEQVKQVLELASSMNRSNARNAQRPATVRLIDVLSNQPGGLSKGVPKGVNMTKRGVDLNVDRSSPDDPELLPSATRAEVDPTLELKSGEEEIERTAKMAKFIVVPICIVFFIIYNIVTIMEKLEITFIPESGVVIMIGIVLGYFMKRFAMLDFFNDQEAWAHLNTVVLNLVLLPIIIFSSGWSVRRQDFFSQLPYILMFAVVGTAIATTVVASLIVFTGSYGFHSIVGWRTAFVYASLISATDPVATLGTYAKLKVEPLLNIMVFGESTINDAVAIVLFKVFNDNAYFFDPVTGDSLQIGMPLLYNILYGIAEGSLVSLCLGVALGMVYCVIAKWCEMKTNSNGQILVIFISCFLTYSIAESLELSGIIAVTFCSLLMGVYMPPHLSAEGFERSSFFLEQVAQLADSAVFLLVGVSVTQLTLKGWYFGLWVMLFCLIGRACATLPIAGFVNSLKAARGMLEGTEKEGCHLLSRSHIFMIWHAGLRGGIALALAWELGKWVDEVEGPGTRKSLQTATFLTIVVFLAVFGGTTSWALKYTGIPIGTDEPEDVLSSTEGTGQSNRILQAIDQQFLTPLLIGDVKK
jgi:sodium/hydrogen exchanger 8